MLQKVQSHAPWQHLQCNKNINIKCTRFMLKKIICFYPLNWKVALKTYTTRTEEEWNLHKLLLLFVLLQIFPVNESQGHLFNSIPDIRYKPALIQN